MPTAAEIAYDVIRQAIRGGDYKTGDHLREEDLAARASVSRTPVREALRRLAQEGLVEFHTNRGATVARWSPQELKVIYGLRALVEGYAARLAAERIDEQELQHLAELADQMTDLSKAGTEDNLVKIAHLNIEFHRRVLEASGNRLLVDMMTGLAQLPLVLRIFGLYTKDELARSMTHHHEVVEALRVKDPEWAESIMETHVLSARHTFD